MVAVQAARRRVKFRAFDRCVPAVKAARRRVVQFGAFDRCVPVVPFPAGRRRVAVPAVPLFRRIRTKPKGEAGRVARPQDGGGGRERRLRVTRSSGQVPHDRDGHVDNTVAVAVRTILLVH